MNYKNKYVCKPLPQNSTSYAFYARSTDKEVTIYADFETTAQRFQYKCNDVVLATYEDNNLKEIEKEYPDGNYEILDEPLKVWLAGAYVVEDNEYYYMTNIEEFMNFVAQYKMANVYFHNGGNFDHRFIYHYLKDKHFEHVSTDSRAYTQKFFVGNYDSLTVYNQGQMANFRDSKGLIKSSIKEMGDNLIVTELSEADESLREFYEFCDDDNDDNYGKYVLRKGDTPIKYNNDNLTPTDYDLEYQFRDVMILALSANRSDSYNLPLFYSNGLTTTASLAEAEMYEPGIIERLEKKPFTLDNVPKMSQANTRMVTGWYLSIYHGEAPTYRDSGTGGKRTADYIPEIDETGWVHSNYGVHAQGEKYLKSINMEDYQLSYEWDGDYTEYRIKKTSKIKIKKMDDPNGDSKLTRIPNGKMLGEKPYLNKKFKVTGSNFTKQHAKNLAHFYNDLLDLAFDLRDMVDASEALGLKHVNWLNEKLTINAARKLIEKYKHNLKNIDERYQQEKQGIELEELRDMIHNSLKGGITQAHPRHQNIWLYHKELDNIEHLKKEQIDEILEARDKIKQQPLRYINNNITIADVNSLYPFIYSQLPLPGKFKAENGSIKFKDYRDDEELGFVVIRKLIAKIKKDRLPFYKLRTSVLDGQETDMSQTLNHHEYYLPELNIYAKHCITLLEYRSLLRNYDINDIEIECFYYNERHQELMDKLNAHAEKWMVVKEKAKAEHNKFLIAFSKMMLNSPYGKLGNYKQNYDSAFKTINGTMTATDVDELNNRHAQIEAASYITAYGRIMLSETINAIGLDKFLYCDTDSIHYIGAPSALKGLTLPDYLPEPMRHTKLHKTHIGAWDIEGIASAGKYIKAKCYAEVTDKWHTTVAGVTGNIDVENFKTYDLRDNSPIYTLRARNVKGGVSLYRSNFKIKPINPFYRMAYGDVEAMNLINDMLDHKELYKMFSKIDDNSI